jgi:hypothetical protein
MTVFRLVDCPECGEEININVTKTCPECKAIYAGAMQPEFAENVQKSNPLKRPMPTNEETSIEARLAQIQYLLYKIHRSVAFFSWVLIVSLFVGFLWLLENF